MEDKYDKAGLQGAYRMFCDSVDECLNKLYRSEISDDERSLLEKRVKVTFMMTDFSLSVLEGIEDSFLNEARKGVDERRMKWGHYRSSRFSASKEKMDRAYGDAWAELESNLP